MRLGKDLDNKPIISVSDGQILGRAKDVYLDKELRQLAGLFMGTEGVLRRKDLLIHNDQIVLFGIDVILVKNADVITNAKELPETDAWHRLSQVHGKQVHTPGGTKLATIDDVVLDEQGLVTGFSLSRVYVSGPLAEQPFVPRDVVVDAFDSGDELLVDFPKLEALFAESGTATAVDEKAPAAASEDVGETAETPPDQSENAQ